jgi:hypothetical protein
MSNISAIDHLEAIVDGDTIVPGMKLVLPTGVGSTQYYNPSTGVCTPDYTKAASQILLYPACYSSLKGKFLVPDAGTVQWFLDNPQSDAAKILAAPGGAVADAYKARFAVSSYKVNNQTFPALKVIANLAAADSLNDVTIYCKFMVNGMEVTCNHSIGIRESVGSLFDILIVSTNEEGVNDTVIDNDSEYLVLNASLQDSGADVAATGAWSWQRATSSGLVAVAHVAGLTEITNGGRTLKLYDAAIEGTEEYFAVVGHNGQTYRKGIQVSDTHDPFYINMGRDTLSNLVRETDTIKYTPSVVARSSGAVQPGWSFTYTLRNNVGGTARTSSGTTFQVTGTEVKAAGGLVLHISASKA